MSELFSEMGKSNIDYVRPEKMLVIKASNRDYPSYWNDEKKCWGGLLEATIYRDVEPATVENGEVVDYRVITGLSK